jgi:type I restriction enzyme S subunit
MELQEGYKLTEAGIIPEEWEIKPLNELGTWKGGGTPSKNKEDYWNGNIPWVSPKDFKGIHILETEDRITAKAIAESSTTLIKKNSILIVTRSGILRNYVPIAKNSVDVAINQDLKALTVSESYDSEFVFQSLRAFARQIKDGTVKVGTTVESIDFGALKKVQIPIPLLPTEQQAVAEALSDVDSLIASLKQLIIKKRNIKQGAIQQLLTGNKRLTGFTDEWHEKKIGDIAPLQRGFDLPGRELRNGNYPVVYSNGILNRHVTYKAKAPGVVTGRSGTIGKVIFVEEDYFPHNTTLWVTDFKGNDPKYIYYLYAFLKLERFSTGSGVPTLNRNDVHAYSISIPRTNAEQKAIAQTLSDMDEGIEKLEEQYDKYEAIKQGMMQDLLTGKTRLI